MRFSSPATNLLIVLALGQGVADSASAVDPVFRQSVVFSSGDGYAAYRIPAIVTTGFGTILAFAEGRPTVADLGENDIVLKRSLDGGQTWQPMSVTLSHTAANLATRGFNNPTPVVDRTTGDIFLFASRPALNGQENSYEMYVSKSTDDGVTWSAPTNISADVRPNGDKYITPGPGHAIQMENGRLVIPMYSRDLNLNSRSAVPHMVYSDDHGTSWHLGGEVPKPPTYPGESLPISLVEPSIVETENGLYMNMRTRDYAESPESALLRSHSFSTDGGMTWTTSQQDPTLLDHNSQGSVARWTTEAADGVNRILLSNAASSIGRNNLSVTTSYDEALSWENRRTIDFGMSAYSDMAASADGTMNLLYENGRAGDPRFSSVSLYQQISLAQFNTQWLETPQIYALQYDFAESAPGNSVSTADAGIKDSNSWLIDGQGVGDMIYVQGHPSLDGRAISLNGDGDAVLIRNADSQHFFNLTASDSFTVEAVLRTTMHGDGGLDGAGMIMGRGAQVADNSLLFSPHWYMQIVDGKLNFNLRDAAGVVASVTSDETINDGSWHAVAATRDANNHILTISIDGRQVGYVIDPTGTFDGLNDASDTYIGKLSDGSRSLIADLDRVRFSLATPSDFQLTSIPEPSSLCLTLFAAAGIIGRSRLKRYFKKENSA